MKNKLALILMTAVLTMACNSDYIQKPRGYFRIPLPPKKYQPFDQPQYPYSFEYPIYGRIEKDSLFFEEKAENPYWINVDFPVFNAKLYLSYKEIGSNKFD